MKQDPRDVDKSDGNTQIMHDKMLTYPRNEDKSDKADPFLEDTNVTDYNGMITDALRH